jgi:hypothetical protein
LSVSENTSLHLFNVELNSEGSVGSNGRIAVGRECKFGRRHVVEGGDVTDGAGVAGALLDLFAVGVGLTDTEVDEVVGGSDRLGLAFSGSFLASEAETLADDGRVKGQRCLSGTVISPIVTTVVAAIIATITGVVSTVVATV